MKLSRAVEMLMRTVQIEAVVTQYETGRHRVRKGESSLTISGLKPDFQVMTFYSASERLTLPANNIIIRREEIGAFL